MESTPEFAVLKSVSAFAFKQVEINPSSLQKGESTKIIEILEEPIKEIIEGLDDQRSIQQQKWWTAKLNALFLLNTQVQNTNNNSVQINYFLPTFSYDAYFDMVKSFNWFDSFLEVPILLKTTERINCYKKLLAHVQQDPVNHLDLQLISSLIGHFIQLKISNQPISRDEQSVKELLELLSKFLDWILMHHEKLKLLGFEQLCEFLNRILLLPLLTLDTTGLKFGQNGQDCFFFSKMCQESGGEVCDLNNFPCVYWIRSIQIVSKYLAENTDLELSVIFKREIFKINSIHVQTLDLCEQFQKIKDVLFKNLPSELDRDKERLLNIFHDVFTELKLLSQKEKQETKEIQMSAESCLKRIEKRNPGFEDDVENLLKNDDLNVWETEGYLDMLLDNPEVLYKEQYLYTLLQLCDIQTKVSVKLNKLICLVFYNLPLILQQKFILHVYIYYPRIELLPWKQFDSELTTIFNKFTNNSNHEVLKDISYLMLINLKSTMERLVKTVISNPGQIDTVIQIFQSMPELCECRHPIYHPNKTLLVMSLHQVLSTLHIDKQQEKNFFKFISCILKDYEYKVLNDIVQQKISVLNMTEFVGHCVIPCIKSDSLYSDNQPLSLEFTIKLFTLILDQSRDRPYDWFKHVNPIVILLLIGDIHNECAQPLVEIEYYHTRIMIRQLLHKLLASMKNVLRRNEYQVEAESFDWFLNEIEEFDWKIKIVLYKFITCFIEDGQRLYKQLLESVIETTIRTGNIKLLFELGVISEEILSLVMEYEDLKSVEFTVESFSQALTQVLPNLLPTEWSRLYQIIQCLIEKVDFSLRLMFLDKIAPSHLSEVYKEIMSIQIINDAVLILIPYLLENILQHVLRSYTALIQSILNQQNLQKSLNGSRLLLLVEIYSYLCVTMATVTKEFQETVFVSLLDVLAEVKKVTSSLKNSVYRQPFYKAMQTVKDRKMSQTLLTRLDEIFYNQ